MLDGRGGHRSRHSQRIGINHDSMNRGAEAAKWRKTEWTQLSKYQNQGMFGEPCERPDDPNAVILPFVWTYVHKIDPLTGAIVEKARGTCNGGKRHGKAVTIAETYAACVEQPAQRLYWALVH
jgi:hypothetical protein